MSEARHDRVGFGRSRGPKKSCRSPCSWLSWSRTVVLLFPLFFSDGSNFFLTFFSTRTKIDGTGIPPTVSVSACASGGSNLRSGIVHRFGDYNRGSPSRSLSLFLRLITIPDGRAITMKKKSSWDVQLTDSFHFPKHTHLRRGSLHPVSVSCWKLAGELVTDIQAGTVIRATHSVAVGVSPPFHRQSVNLHFLCGGYPGRPPEEKKKRWHPTFTLYLSLSPSLCAGGPLEPWEKPN